MSSSITTPMTDEVFASASALPRWPNNTNTSPEYKTARNDLLRSEHELRRQIELVAAQRRALPPGPIMASYTFSEGPASLNEDTPTASTTLADLTSSGRSLVLYHMMFEPSTNDGAVAEPCAMCSMAIDSYNACAPHLAENITFAIVAKAPLSQLRAWAKKRGWSNLRFLSSFDSTFNADINVESKSDDGSVRQEPGVSVFRRDEGGNVRFVYQAFPWIEPGSERGLDLLNGVYNILDLVPEGRGGWYAENDYL